MPSNVAGNTFRAINLEPLATSELKFPQFVEALLQKLGLLKEERFLYYEDLRRKNSKWANGSRWVLALLGSISTASHLKTPRTVQVDVQTSDKRRQQ